MTKYLLRAFFMVGWAYLIFLWLLFANIFREMALERRGLKCRCGSDYELVQTSPISRWDKLLRWFGLRSLECMQCRAIHHRKPRREWGRHARWLQRLAERRQARCVPGCGQECGRPMIGRRYPRS